MTEASGLRKQLRRSSFIVCFYNKYEIASVVAAQLNDIREDAASEFQNIFTKCQAMAASADTTYYRSKNSISTDFARQC